MSYEPLRHHSRQAVDDEDHARKLLAPESEGYQDRRHSVPGNTSVNNISINTSPRPSFSNARDLPHRPAVRQPKSYLRIALRLVGFVFAAVILGIQAYSVAKWITTRKDWWYNPKTKLRTRRKKCSRFETMLRTDC
jgi:hypothetical protein